MGTLPTLVVIFINFHILYIVQFKLDTKFLKYSLNIIKTQILNYGHLGPFWKFSLSFLSGPMYPSSEVLEESFDY